MALIQKRDGQLEGFQKSKIVNAILAAFDDVDGDKIDVDYTLSKANNIADYVAKKAEDKVLNVEEIQDMVESGLCSTKRHDVAKAYIIYRNERTKERGNSTDKEFNDFLIGKNKYWETENSNKNPKIVTTQRDYIAGIASTDLARRFIFPQDVVKAHDEGIIHIHDMDYAAQNVLHNCELVNLEDMLQNGTVINNVLIEKPHRFITACTIATQIITAVTSSSYGGCTITLTHLAPFVRDSYDIYYNKYKDRGFNEIECITFAHEDLYKEIVDGVQTFNYQVNSMTNTNGQAPFLSVMMYLGETEEYKKELAMIIKEFLNQRYKGFKNEVGVYVTPAFPKLLYVLEEDNIHEDSKYWYLTELAAKCSAKRLTPDYISEKKMKELKINPNTGNGECYPCMGCRAFLTPDRTTKNYAKANNYNPAKGKYYGRFNCGAVTVNLMDVALSSKRNKEDFWKILNERCELCHKANKIRLNRLETATSDVAPILWQYGALARLDKGKSLYDLIHNGYATVSLGYAALYECTKVMTGKSHMDEAEGEKFALEVMDFLNKKTQEWKEKENIDYSLYGTPIETTTYKFAKAIKRRFGEITFERLDGKDRNYVTNSYHCPVFEKIGPFEKLEKENKFQEKSPGGMISYIESVNLQNNLSAVLEVIKFIYNHIMYAEINTKSDYCQKCGFDGEIKINEKDMSWYCPNCGNTDQSTMNVARRTCGYIGSNFWNFGRTQEIAERVVHLQ